ncbi:trihelix transcription factor ASR3-like isoform X2 [Telopea speciosissima]|uniref:trihelix transcription factor ASR3-like isoform X2 n=1 Tax=Telopea speciosissima TaxID=54955 RepID=UPI001CC533E1|nr:trihelix transcription factor ASR3-like isoform X2 [Telopea speciosissima]
MAHEQLSPAAAAAATAPVPVDAHPHATLPRTNGFDGADDANRPPRLPRWTRQEILVLIQGKKVAENRVRRGRAAGSAFGSNILEPKWASVSSYCKRHGVNRGPVQCRKRWSNLAGDYKKIKEWESLIKEESESFWVMRNDLRRERKLPGFFDREVYDILDGGNGTATSASPVTAISDLKDNEGLVAAPEVAAEEEEPVFDSGRSAAAEDGLFSDFEQPEEAGGSPTMTVRAPLPISEKQFQPLWKGDLEQGTTNEKQPTVNPEKGSTSQEEGRKRRRLASDIGGEATLQDHLIKVLERNSGMLAAQLESQNINCQLDRDQRKDHAGSLVAVLSKLADALGKIADKL